METVTLGRTELEITPIGFGAWAIGGAGWEFAWGPQDDDESVAAIHRALDLGINWIDTAAAYGLGHSEKLVARALRGLSVRPYVFTKCERVWDAEGNLGHCLEADSIRRECEASLRRLQVDAIDLYQVHWPQPEEEIEEGWATLAELKAEGKVRHIGVSNFGIEHLRRAELVTPVETLQPPHSLINRAAEEETLPYCGQKGIGVIVYSPMGSGLLTGAMTRARVAALPDDDWRRHNQQFQEPLLSRNLARVERLREIGARHGRSPGEVAVAWTLRHPAVTAAIVGFRRAAQVDGIVGAAGFRLSDEEAEELESLVS